MRKLIVSTFLTLDGVMQAPGGPEEDESGGFAHGGWSVNYWDDQMGQIMGQAMSKPFDLVLGRSALEMMGALAATLSSFIILHVLGQLEWPKNFSLMLVGLLYMAWWSMARSGGSMSTTA